MNKVIKLLVASASLLSLIGASVACEPSPCDTLADRCGNCATDAARVNCEIAVEWDIDDACQDNLDDQTFAQSCPE